MSASFTNNLKKTYSFLVFCTILHFSKAQHDDRILQALGDHGDRIANMENLIQKLIGGQTRLKLEVSQLRTENAILKGELKNVTDNCCSVPVACLTPSSNLLTTDISHVSNETTINPLITSTDYLQQGNNQTTTKSSSTMTGSTLTTIADTSITTIKTTTPTTIKTTPPPTTEKTTTTPTTTEKTTTPLKTTPAEPVYASCDEAIANNGKNGTYLIGSDVTVMKAYCEVENGHIWLVIQRRVDGNVNFNRNWSEYASGFGDMKNDFWLGNDNIYYLTSVAGDYTLRIEMADWGGNHVYAEYTHFKVRGPTTNYVMTAGGYTGTAGDSFHYQQSYMLSHHGMQFSTPDVDNDQSSLNCAKKLQSGWWFNSCYSSNLNGKFLAHAYGQRMLGETAGQPTLDGTGMEWYPYRKRQYSMRSVEMKIRLDNPNTGVVLG